MKWHFIYRQTSRLWYWDVWGTLAEVCVGLRRGTAAVHLWCDYCGVCLIIAPRSLIGSQDEQAVYIYAVLAAAHTRSHLHSGSQIQGWEIDKNNYLKKKRPPCRFNEACESGWQWGCLMLINFFLCGSSTHDECCSSTQPDFRCLCLPESDSCP